MRALCHSERRDHKRDQRALVAVRDAALRAALFRRARQAIRRLGGERLRQSYWTTFWMPLEAPARNAIEEVVLALAHLALPAGHGCAGAEWWLGRSHTTDVPIELHFDQDVKLRERGGPLRHPHTSSVLFFNRVRGGQLAVTDQRPGPRGEPCPARAGALQTVAPRANRYAVFAGDLLHGVLDAEGRVPSRRLPGPKGRLRLTLVVNFWRECPTGVLPWSRAKAYRALALTPRGRAAGRARTGPRSTQSPRTRPGSGSSRRPA
jgi:hypothetical protein